MDMQDVSNLAIPEGQVRTIHDKNNMLLWGRVAYDVRYVGDTTQNGTPTPDSPVTIKTVTGSQTVKVMGKNLFLCPNMSSGTGITRTRLGDNSFKATVNSTDGNKYTQIDYALSPNTTYYFSANISISGDSITHTGAVRPRIEGSYIGWYNNGFSFTTGASGSVRFLFYNYSDNTGGATVNNTVTWSNIQIEKGSAYSSYEPYQAKSYTVNLGATELCKLGDYQDYIYNSGDDWYVHKEVRHLQLAISDMNNSEDYPGWTGQTQFKADLGATSGGSVYTDTDMVTNIAGLVTTDSRSVSKNFNGTNATILLSKSYYGNDYTQTYWQSNYSSLVVDFYYGINVLPADTQITNATLIGQLNAVHEWLTRYGYNATVSGNLPIIITKTNL